MKKLFFSLLAVASVLACNPKQAAVHPEWTYNSVVYEVNIRQFSPEGSFKGVEAQLPRLKDLGVDVLWLMPMYEIGQVERKGSLGSYYAISDYKKVNPEFGTMEDFEQLLNAAHAMGFKVILDWVANQTAPDHVWMTEKPADFYERDADGNAIWEYDWTDTRSLNYDNHELWEAMDDAMRFWLEKGVDGFRCDAAGEMPADFWNEVLPGIRADYPEAYLLAEAERENLAGVFDAEYAWELHHLLNGMAQGSKTVQDLKDYVARDAARFPAETFRLTFTSNHDENSWAGTEFEREGAAAEACAVLCFTLPGSQPLIYTGQEIGLDRRLAFFEKDPITNWEANDYTDFWKNLIALKHNHPALAAGERGGEMVWWEIPEGYINCEGLVAFHRELNGRRVIVLANFGIPAQQQAMAAEAVEGNDNRPQGTAVAEPFLNLQSAPAQLTLNLGESYIDPFSGAVYSEWPCNVELYPGEYLVLAQ